ncbi:protein NRT1/ PTR FAMILY 5.4-like [Arachis duranensis]|uniref:Protein NRT1/ PTR FAMILY 5.4-like n=1 Tax=Arachis duranensis TaxID=130453 RepID=A0A9C6TD41_ARADU|nr:protein NRT1/ PTR FAMILY 5.4-like [Arachis duranensis]
MTQTEGTTMVNDDSNIPAKTTKKGGWHAAIFITCVEFAERFTSMGLSANLITYLTKELSEFLDKAMIIDEHDVANNTRDPWRLCTLNQVEEVKLVLRLIPIWLSCLMFVVVQSQLATFFVKQGSTMNRSLGPNFQIPPASLQGVVGVIILFAVASYDRIFVPIVRKFTGHQSGITVLQRIGIGLFCSTLCMVVSALVEGKRVNAANQHKNNYNTIEGFSPMSIWWLLPQYAILGVADAFAVVGLQELFYTQMSEAMRSVGAAAFLSVLGVGNFVANAIIDIVVEITSKSGGKWLVGNNLNKAHLDYFYWVLAGLSALSLGLYLLVSSSFVYKKVHV